jgi:hypothetical protein
MNRAAGMPFDGARRWIRPVSGFAKGGNAVNPMAGTRLQQAWGWRAEQPVTVERNHGGGTVVWVAPDGRSGFLRGAVGETCASGMSAEGRTNDQERRFGERIDFGWCGRRAGALEAHCRRAKFTMAVSRWSPRLFRVGELRNTSKVSLATGKDHGGCGERQRQPLRGFPRREVNVFGR